MSVKNFKFVSPGVFINEIDNSYVPKSAEAIGPVVVGRSQRGLAMTPVKVESYSQFVEMFGDTVPGAGGGDISRDGNMQSPMYGTYAAKAFLNANVAPLTYVRLLGQQDSANNGASGMAGWETLKDPTAPATVNQDNGGAYGLFVWPSASSADTTRTQLGTGSLGAIILVNSGAAVWVSGTMPGPANTGSEELIKDGQPVQEGVGVVVKSDSSGLFTLHITGADGASEKVSVGFDDSAESFIRKRLNTNPQLVSPAGTFYPSSAYKTYWLGATFEQDLRDRGLVGASGLMGAILPLALGSDVTTGPANKRQASQEAKTGWFIGQDTGLAASFSIESMPKLFQLKGRGHGEWLQRNCKVSIEQIKKSTISSTDYGTFSVVIRRLSDTDNAVEVMERFDNLTLDPTSVNFVARRIGDQYVQWDTTSRRLKTYGDYPNLSKFVYVVMNDDVEAGATDPVLLPWGYFGPPHISGATILTTSSYGGAGGYVYSGSTWGADFSVVMLSGSTSGQTTVLGDLSGSIKIPHVRLRLSASDGNLSDQTKAYFGMQTTRTSDSSLNDPSVADYHRLIKGGFSGGGGDGGATGISDSAYVFSMDDVARSGSSPYGYYWESGSRAGGYALSLTDTIDAGFDSFTAPFFGGFDGFDIKVPDPLYNAGMASSPSDTTNYMYYTWKRGIDTVADPEEINMNLLTAPGLTNDTLTQHMVNVCEDRADSLAVIDLADVYIPPHEAYKATKSERIGTTPTAAATALRTRRIDSSYGSTFYPWVQTRDEATGRMLWIPPSVAMMGVLASSERATAVWFAPAGFNRGGLSDGAAGIPVTSVSERLTSKQRDTLYDNRINPIASFPSSGIVVFGQKTLQERRSALDRINVRRLVIYLKKQISILSTQVLFEQNVQDTWNRFTSLIEPLLSNVQTKFGITDYRLILDETTTTPDLIDQNILYAKIMIKPARAIEFIAIDFVIMNTGASFDD